MKRHDNEPSRCRARIIRMIDLVRELCSPEVINLRHRKNVAPRLLDKDDDPTSRRAIAECPEHVRQWIGGAPASRLKWATEKGNLLTAHIHPIK
jgi:hypothetical protein